MSPQQIKHFFQVLDKHLSDPVRVILTGAAAAALWGGVRPSMDIDFAIEPKRKNRKSSQRIDQALACAMQLTGIPANYAQDIDRWGMISLLDYRKHVVPYQRLEKVELFLLDPAYWAIGKITRYLDPDVQDLVAVFKKQKISFKKIVTVWGRALRESAPSSQRFQFRQHAENFLKVYGRKIWGRAFDLEETVKEFHRCAGIESSA